jgi:DNA modification methylase
MKDAKEVKITAAKGRPMLTWVGKRPLRHVTAFPAQLVETFDPAQSAIRNPQSAIWSDWPAAYPKAGLLFHGDNKEVLAHLLANGFRGKVKLIYIDPPFDSGADYVRKVALRGVTGTAKVDGESYTLGEQIQYTDIWANDNYLQFMYERLMLMRELLTDDGVIFVHCDWHKHHHLRCLLDEVLGADAFRNEIVVKRGRRKNLQSQFETIESLGSETDCIMVYCRSGQSNFGKVLSQIRATPAKWKDFWRGNVDRPSMRYAIPCLNFPKPTRGQLLWSEERGLRAAENYQRFLKSGEQDLETYWRKNGEAYFEQTGHKLEFVNWDGAHIIKYWISPKELGVIGSLWADIEAYSYKHNYKTEKHEGLLARIIEMASDEEDLVLDCFIGSGTTAAVAQKLDRRWIGCDINKGAIQTTSKRLQTIILEQVEAERQRNRQGNFIEEEEESDCPPVQLAFAVYRVNDYDLQIQHNEAVNLACEHIGITRTRTDAYFDGTLGNRLVKLIPFGHPLTLLDLEELKKELEARPDEERGIVLVCLGKEIAVDGWLEDWNRLRLTGSVPNKIEVIELRTDPKYGKFFLHEPARAKVSIQRATGKIVVEIEDFISPTIIERLQQQAGILKPQIGDWRAMVDCVMIDVAYDASVFDICLADVPQKKNDLVEGTYELSAPEETTTVAVKIVDMLGEEVLVTAQV